MSIATVRLQPILFMIGLILAILGLGMLIPIAVYFGSDTADLPAFGISAVITLGCGLALIRGFRRERLELGLRQMFLLTAMAWVTLSAFASLPLIFSHTDLSLTDAVFESVSGITTTGSTVLSGLDQMPRTILLWRALLQWLGGIGIIAMAVAIFPFLRVGGMRLFQTESSDWSEKAVPRAAELVRALITTYLTISGLCLAAYLAGGMDLFNAVTHMFTTVSTGGYSPHDASFGYFESPLLKWSCIGFMLLGALPFVLYIRAFRGERQALTKDQQVRGFFLFLALVIGALTLWRHLTAESGGLFDHLTQVAFNVISVVTTTGYATADYTAWGGLAVAAFFFLTFVGGCSGSTSGGIKIFRYQVGFIFLQEQVMKLIHPNMTCPGRYNRRPLSQEVVISVVAFCMAFAMVFALLTIALALLGLDMITAISGAATALTNVGPGLGDTIGPAGNFQTLPDTAKWLLCFGMILGRLELMGILLLFTPGYWRG